MQKYRLDVIIVNRLITIIPREETMAATPQPSPLQIEMPARMRLMLAKITSSDSTTANAIPQFLNVDTDSGRENSV